MPGLRAKPIVDIAIGLVPGAAAEAAASAVRGLGYEYRGDWGADGGHVLVRDSEPLVRTHHVHIVDLNGPQWESYLLLRDFLRRDARARQVYSTEKTKLAQRYPNDRVHCRQVWPQLRVHPISAAEAMDDRLSAGETARSGGCRASSRA